MTAWTVLGWLLAVPAVTSTAYFWIARAALRRWLAEGAGGEPAMTALPPVTFFRPLKSGVPELSEKLAMLAGALRPGDQLLLGAVPGSEEWAIAEKVARTFPEREIAAVACAPDAARNPKVAKLIQMEPLARHERWIVSDAEALMDADFLAAFRREWARCDVLTCGYRFAPIATWPQRLDAAAALLGLWPGLAVVRAAGRVRFTLGACTGLARGDLQAVGGWVAFAEVLAEDHRLGKLLAAAGRTIRLSVQVVTLGSDALSWGDYWRHQRRVAVTYRVADAAGFAGMLLTQGVTTSLLLAALRPGEMLAWALFVVVFASRCLTARHATRALAFRISRLIPTVLLASLVETICWALSWGTREISWGVARWRISRSGRMRRV